MANPKDPLDRFEQRLAETFATARPRVNIGQAKQRLLQAAADRDRPIGRQSTRWASRMLQWDALVPSVALIAAVIFSAVVLIPSQTVVGAHDGGISVFRPILARWSPLTSGEIPADVLLRAEVENAELTLRDRSVLTLGAGSQFRLYDTKGVAVELQRGRLEAKVQSQPKGKKFRVLLPNDVEIAVIGTHFVVTVEETP